MEYSKEDLMEAKRQILGVGENMGTEESKKIWEKNAQFWDNLKRESIRTYHLRQFITAEESWDLFSEKIKK